MEVSRQSWFNGKVTTLEAGAPSIASVNFHLGTSVFDGLMAYWNRDHYYLHYGLEHLQRFKAGAATMELNFIWTAEELLEGVQELLQSEDPKTYYIRPIAYRRAAELWITGNTEKPVDVSIFAVPLRRELGKAISCHISPIERISSRSIPGRTKVSGAYVNSFYARRQAELFGFQDGIMLDRRGLVAEASAANLFIMNSGALITPALGDDVFPGITRSMVLTLAGEAGIPVLEASVPRQDLLDCDGAFLCSTAMELRPICNLEGRELPTVQSEVFQVLMARFDRLTDQ
jgi:branched-chain amino acid aminotransferase